jgi:threonine/homoserine/homoserine lactone efflux protein
MGDLGAFLVVAALVIVSPGQDTALTIRNTLVGGRRAGAGTALGVATGQAVWTLAASAGLAALLIASEPVFTALRLAGAAYLVYLGLHALLAAVRRGPRERAARAWPGGRALAPVVAFRHGLVSNLGNAKMAVFFTSLLPQFADGGGFALLLGLGLLFCAMTLLWLSAYALAVDRAGRVLRREPVRRTLDAVTGAVLVALGIRLLVEPAGKPGA